jgi:hypothetical protein
MQSPTSILRELKGSPLSCLLALMIAGGAVSEKWIMAATGYAQGAVRLGLLHLETIQLAGQSSRYSGWCLTDGARQIPLLAELETLSAGTAPAAITNETRESRLTTLPGSATTTTSDVVETLNTEEKAAEEERESRLTTLAALQTAGIMGKKAVELANLPHVTPEFVQAHARRAFKERKPTAILICRIRDGDRIPEDITDEERQRAREVASRRRYIDGPLGAYIEH